MNDERQTRQSNESDADDHWKNFSTLQGTTKALPTQGKDNNSGNKRKNNKPKLRTKSLARIFGKDGNGKMKVALSNTWF